MTSVGNICILGMYFWRFKNISWDILIVVSVSTFWFCVRHSRNLTLFNIFGHGENTWYIHHRQILVGVRGTGANASLRPHLAVVQFSHFQAVFGGKLAKIIGWRPDLSDWPFPSGESRIRHCPLFLFFVLLSLKNKKPAHVKQSFLIQNVDEYVATLST